MYIYNIYLHAHENPLGAIPIVFFMFKLRVCSFLRKGHQKGTQHTHTHTILGVSPFRHSHVPMALHWKALLKRGSSFCGCLFGQCCKTKLYLLSHIGMPLFLPSRIPAGLKHEAQRGVPWDVVAFRRGVAEQHLLHALVPAQGAMRLHEAFQTKMVTMLDVKHKDAQVVSPEGPEPICTLEP